MSTSLNWPDELPGVKLSGLSAKFQNPVIRTEMDAGPAKQRLRYTAVPKLFTCTITVPEDKRQVFEAFWQDTLGYGTLRFNMHDPMTGTVKEFRFTDVYNEVYGDDGLCTVSMPLERMI